MADLPAMLRVAGRRVVIVGGGAVARRRSAALVEADAKVTVIAPAIGGGMPRGITAVRRAYRRSDLKGAMLVVICTDDATVNRRVAQDARAEGVLVNRADDPADGDVTIPAHAHHGPVTIAVSTGGVSAAAAAAIRRELSRALGRDWPTLLTVACPYRRLIQQRFAGAQRRGRLTRLTNALARATLKSKGRAGLRDYFERLSRPTQPRRSNGPGA